MRERKMNYCEWQYQCFRAQNTYRKDGNRQAYQELIKSLLKQYNYGVKVGK